MASEHKERALAQEFTGGVTGEYALFSFSDKKRGEELRKAACVWVENLEQKILDTIKYNHRLECKINHMPNRQSNDSHFPCAERSG